MLMVIGGLAWDLTARFNRERLDREMRNIAKANLQRTGDEKHWQRAEEALRFVAGPDRSFEHVLWVKNYDRVVDRSPRWPTEIAPGNYPPPTRYADGLAFTTPPPPPRRVEFSQDNPPLPTKDLFFTANTGSRSWRIGVMGNPDTTLALAADLTEFNADFAQRRWRFLAAIPWLC